MNSNQRTAKRFYHSPILFYFILFVFGILISLEAISPFIAKEYLKKCESVLYFFKLINIALLFLVIPYARRGKKDLNWVEGVIFFLGLFVFIFILYYLLK